MLLKFNDDSFKGFKDSFKLKNDIIKEEDKHEEIDVKYLNQEIIAVLQTNFNLELKEEDVKLIEGISQQFKEAVPSSINVSNICTFAEIAAKLAMLAIKVESTADKTSVTALIQSYIENLKNMTDSTSEAIYFEKAEAFKSNLHNIFINIMKETPTDKFYTDKKEAIEQLKANLSKAAASDPNLKKLNDLLQKDSPENNYIDQFRQSFLSNKYQVHDLKRSTQLFDSVLNNISISKNIIDKKISFTNIAEDDNDAGYKQVYVISNTSLPGQFYNDSELLANKIEETFDFEIDVLENYAIDKIALDDISKLEVERIKKDDNMQNIIQYFKAQEKVNPNFVNKLISDTSHQSMFKLYTILKSHGLLEDEEMIVNSEDEGNLSKESDKLTDKISESDISKALGGLDLEMLKQFEATSIQTENKDSKLNRKEPKTGK